MSKSHDGEDHPQIGRPETDPPVLYPTLVPDPAPADAPPPDPMAAAIDWLRRHRIAHSVKTKYHIKIGTRLSYYPRRETFYEDGAAAAVRSVSLEALGEILRKRGYKC